MQILEMKKIKVPVGDNGLTVDVPVTLVRGGRTRFDVGLLVSSKEFPTGPGTTLAVEALKTALMQEGYTHPVEQVARVLSRSQQKNTGDFFGIAVRVYGVNCGYPFASLETLS